jgi:hypothetical protein
MYDLGVFGQSRPGNDGEGDCGNIGNHSRAGITSSRITTQILFRHCPAQILEHIAIRLPGQSRENLGILGCFVSVAKDLYLAQNQILPGRH